MLAALFVMSLLFWNGSGSDSNGSPLFHLLTGATMLGAFFILDDPIFSGLAVSLIFGILVSTLLTLVVIPVLYYIVWRKPASRAA
jgi:electron transport complex protein RnfD